MVVVIGLIMIAGGFFLGLFDDVEVENEESEYEMNLRDDIQFDPWADEWYGHGPWWKKW